MTKKHTSANSAQNTEKAFWDHLFSIASTLEDTTSPTNTHMAGIQEHMESIEALYHRTFDPVQSYPEYVAVTLCRAINRTLSEKGSSKT